MQSKTVLGLLGAILVVAGGAFLFWQTQNAPVPVTPPAEAVVDAGFAQPPLDAGTDTFEEPITESGVRISPDALLRKIAAKGTKSSKLADWLEAPGLLRRIAAAIRLVAEGRSPRGVLSFIRIEGHFSVVDSWDTEARKAGLIPKGVPKSDRDRIFIAPECYARYDEVARIVMAADMEAWGRGYKRLRPHFNRVFAEIAKPNEKFDDLLETAIARLVAVEVPEGQAELVGTGAIYQFKDPALEKLPEAEKHLVRMGSSNAVSIQKALRQFAKSAGIGLEPK